MKTAFQKQFTTNNTTITGDAENGSLTLHQTVVASWTPDELTLDGDGDNESPNE